MDNRRRGHNDAPYAAQDPRFTNDQNQTRGFAASAPERYRPAPISTSPNRGVAGTTAYPGFYQEPASTFNGNMIQNGMQYQGSYPQDQRQQQSYNTYGSDMYEVAPQAPQSNVYDTAPQYQTRQPTGMQMMPDVQPPYMLNEGANPTAPTLQHHTSSSSSNVYQQGSPNNRMIQPGYTAAIPMDAMSQNAPVIMPEAQFATGADDLEAAYRTYQTALTETFQNISNGWLGEASQSLLDVSEWLLGHVEELGLCVDEERLHPDRIHLWGQFNTAWLGIFQKQKDMLEAGRQITAPQSLMSQKFINKMMNDLIRLCDSIEKFGLVDYQLGVAEERIVAIAEEALDLQEAVEGSSTVS